MQRNKSLQRSDQPCSYYQEKKAKPFKIGDDIEITIVATANDQVKIGIQAPKNIEILRKELFEEIQDENKAASASVDNLLTNIKNLSNFKK